MHLSQSLVCPTLTSLSFCLLSVCVSQSVISLSPLSPACLPAFCASVCLVSVCLSLSIISLSPLSPVLSSCLLYVSVSRSLVCCHSHQFVFLLSVHLSVWCLSALCLARSACLVNKSDVSCTNVTLFPHS